ncbi:MAG TPA: signal peptide peptidase SppA [Candidatus Eisenbacteria bacterium]|nr:signal peptide peptidase SppA [Candidatus Eisenbacteria bacterium]
MASRHAVLGVVLFVAVIVALVLAAGLVLRGGPVSAGQATVLVLDAPAVLEESQPPPGPFPFSRSWRTRLTVWDVVRGIDHAADDDRVRGIALHVDTIDWGWAKVAEVRDALARFRAQGKPVWVSLTGGGEREYLLATAGSRVTMPPTATLELDGLSLTALFYRGAFDKFGITPNFAHVGRYKSAVESYTRTGFSPDARASMESLLDELYGLLVDSVAVARHTTPDHVRALIDDGPYEAPDARRAGLIDTLMYQVEMDSTAVRDGSRRAATTSFARYVDRLEEPRVGPRIALVVAAGAIVSGRSRDVPGQGAVMGSDTVVEALRQARTRRGIRAIVLRVDSPGGSGQASDDIWREVERCRRVKPVIVSMSDYAASGGYYIAVGADSLVAEPATLTGSIGVFGGKLNVVGLLKKVGLSTETIARGRHAEMLSPFRDFSPEESARYQHGLEVFYHGFVARVARGRGLPEASVDSMGQGRVWTGLAARRRGLVDRIGGLREAFDMARRRAHVAPDEPLAVETFPHVSRSFMQQVFDTLWSPDDDTQDAAPLPEVIAAWLEATRFPAGAVMALMPVHLDIR